MRRGLLQDYANTLRDIAEGWRLFNDLDLLVGLGAGTIEVDVLDGAAHLAGEPVLDLRMADELRLWLVERVELDRCPPDAISSAMVTIEFMSEGPGDRFSLRWRSWASVSTTEATFLAQPTH